MASFYAPLDKVEIVGRSRDEKQMPAVSEAEIDSHKREDRVKKSYFLNTLSSVDPERVLDIARPALRMPCKLLKRKAFVS